MSEIRWEGEGAAVLAQWFFASGEDVAAGDVVCELMQEKAVIEVTAPVAGRLTIVASVDQELAPGALLGSIAG